jgi:hypothetical protein
MQVKDEKLQHGIGEEFLKAADDRCERSIAFFRTLFKDAGNSLKTEGFIGEHTDANRSSGVDRDHPFPPGLKQED